MEPKKKRAKTGGRQKGSRNKLKEEAIAVAKAAGRTPAEVLLRLTLDAEQDYVRVFDLTPPEMRGIDKTLVDLRKHALDCASAAAPYFNPKLAQIEAKLDDDLAGALTIQIVRQGLAEVANGHSAEPVH